MNAKLKILFRWTPYNHYTIPYLLGVLDERLKREKFHVGTFEKAGDISAELRSVKNGRMVLAYSFATPQFKPIREEIRTLREAFGAKPVILCGGPHTSADPESVLSAGADYALTGEGEESLPDLLLKLSDGTPPPRPSVIASMPIADFESYPPFASERGLLAPIEIRRGCLSGCRFCQTPALFPSIRERSVPYVVKYCREIKKSGRNIVYFITPDALSYGSASGGVDLAFLEAFFRSMSEEGMLMNYGTFPSEVSPGKLARFPEAASLIKRYAANNKIVLGGQSGSDRVLGIMGRDHTAGDIDVSSRVTALAGLTPMIDMLFGFPGETPGDRKASLSLMKKLARRDKARFNAHYFLPLPGSPMAGARPEKLDERTVREISSHIKSGVVIGDFFEQMKLGEAISCKL